MDKAKGVVRSGWHPSGKDGKKESWRGDFKGINQVAGKFGKGKDPHQAAEEHQSRPLATLKDPDAFGPPPKNVNYHGGAAVPNAITPDRRGLGAPLSAEEIHAQREREESEKRAQEEAAQKPVPPPVPYRVDTTGLPTGNLPKPPVRRIDAADPSQSSQHSARPAPKPKPSLPPRLPPRGSATPTNDAPPSYTSATKGPSTATGLNESALERLGSAGVSVPGLNIGGRPEAASQGHAENSFENPKNASQKPTLGGLHAQFSGLSTKAPISETSSEEGTSFAQKQAALNTASSFRKDPSSVSLSDAKATASTASDFHKRHGDQVTSGLKTASAFNQKYDIAGKVGNYTGNNSERGEISPAMGDQDLVSPSQAKKVPPPPPSKRGLGINASTPPPVPMSSKPRP